MEGNIIDRSRGIGLETNGVSTKSRITGAKSTVFISDNPHPPAILWNNHVITGLSTFIIVRSAEQTQRIFLRSNRFMKHNDHRGILHKPSLRIHTETSVVIGWVGSLKGFRQNSSGAQTPLDELHCELRGNLTAGSTRNATKFFVCTRAFCRLAWSTRAGIRQLVEKTIDVILIRQRLLFEPWERGAARDQKQAKNG